MRLHIDPTPRPRNRRVIRGCLLERQAHETTNRQGVGGAPCDATLRVDAFEVPDQQQPEVLPRWQTRTPHHRGVERAALVLDEPVEPMGVQQRVQAGIERMPRRRRQVRCRNPQRRLICFTRTHRHLRQCSTRDRSCRSPTRSDFNHGLLKRN
jgi:hypothetical protein